MSCYSTVRGDRLRVTKVDSCGEVVTGTGNQVVSEGFVSVSYSPEIEAAEEILVKNAKGQKCIYDRSRPELKFYGLEMEFCQVNPEMFALLTGQTVVTDWNDDPVGMSINSAVVDTGFALEVWTEIPGQDCTDGNVEYGYFLVPFVQNAIFGDFTIENDAITFTISAETADGNGWGTGPYDVVAQDVAGTAGPLLDPLDPDDHLHFQKTSIAPPAAACAAGAV